MKIAIIICGFFISGTLLLGQNLLQGPNDIVFDSLRDRYLVGNWAGGTIVEIDMSGIQSIFRSDVMNCHGMEIHGDTLYVASHHHIYGIDMVSAEIIQSITVAGSSHLGFITIDASDNLYVSDWEARKIFKVNLATHAVSTLVSSLDFMPLGILCDESRNALILLCMGTNVPIRSVSLPDGIISMFIPTTLDDLDAIAEDAFGNYYVTSCTGNKVYRFDHAFELPPEVVSTGHDWPSGLGYNTRDHVLGVTNYQSDSIDLIELQSTFIGRDHSSESASDCLLSQNFPNPFNSYTTGAFYIPVASFASLMLYHAIGHEIEVLLQ